ncbi:MAG: glycosyltransferase, partial [Candidatus Aminicenantales bacterium]
MANERWLDMPFDQYQRYRASAEIIATIKKETGKDKLKVLDVGGYFKNAEGRDTLPLKEFVPDEDVLVLDIADCHLPQYIRGDGTSMPFHPRSFDVVVSQDVLEHIAPEERGKFLDSLIQTAGHFVVLGAPFRTENSILAEKILYEFILKTLKGKHQELEEHIQNGLPEVKEVESFLAKKKLSFCSFPSGYLNNWLLLMMVKHYILPLPDSQHLLALIDRFYNRNFYESDQRGPAYRHVFVISKSRRDGAILEKISDKFQNYREKYKHMTLEKSDFSHLQTLLSLEALRDKNKIEDLQKHIQNLERHIQQLEKAVKTQEVHIANYKKEVSEKKNLIQNLEKDIYDKDVHIRNLENNMNMILQSKVWRTADFFRRIFYMKILKIFPPFQKAALTLTREGFSSFWQKVRKREMMRRKELYDLWMEKHDLTEERIKAIREEIESFPHKPKISIIMPVYNVEKTWLEKAIESVFGQIYPNWELCIVDDASTKKHVKETLLKHKDREKVKIKFLRENRGISGASNQALSLASGEFVGFLDHDDELSPDALFEVARMLNEHPEADIIYSDEDKLNAGGRRIEPHFKPDWSPDLFLSYNYICHFLVMRKELVDGLNGFREGFEGSQDYDLLLRATEKTDKIFHIPKVLYHWRQIKGSTAILHREK